MLDFGDEVDKLRQENFDSALEEIQYQQELLRQKGYVIKVLKVISELKKLINHPEIYKNEIMFAEFVHVFDADDKTNFIACVLLDIDLVNPNKNNKNKSSTPLNKEISKILKNISKYPDDYVNSEFYFNPVMIDWTEDGIDSLKQCFLSKELLIAMNYADMQKDMPIKSEVNQQKNKI